MEHMEQGEFGKDLADWVEEFGGEEFRKALAEAQLAGLSEGEESEPSEPKFQSVVERLERKGKAGAPQPSTAPKQESAEGEAVQEQPATAAVQPQPPQITEEHLRQWLGDEWDAMTEAQKKQAFLSYYNYVMLNQLVDALKSFAEATDQRFKEIIEQSEEDEAVKELTEALIEASEKAGLSEDEIEEVARIMEEKGIINPTAAVEYYVLLKRLSPTHVGAVRRATPAPKAAQQSVSSAPAQPSAPVEETEEVSGFADFVRKVLPKSPEGRQLLRKIPI